eukprot:TRINITY_DN16445_c0_g1_i1.p1 TRINITY_DN16445_c0_g1~~TRINITY_DN16445_c0_g1_i1.p1  ORF type:complete len:202 (-),score=47.77 TRINITY_DN16445_c0_g1_i1:388-993(-)
MGATCSAPSNSSTLFTGGPVTLYYHTACKGFYGRGLPVLLLLEAAGAKYEVKMPEEAPKGTGFATPMVQFPNGTSIAQLPAIMMSLGEGLGLAPSAPEDKVKYMQLILDASDLLSDSGKGQERVDKWLDHFETQMTASGSGYVMQTLSAADFMLFLPAYNVNKKDQINASKFPKFAAWFAMMQEQPAAKKLLSSGIAVMPS